MCCAAGLWHSMNCCALQCFLGGTWGSSSLRSMVRLPAFMFLQPVSLGLLSFWRFPSCKDFSWRLGCHFCWKRDQGLFLGVFLWECGCVNAIVPLSPTETSKFPPILGSSFLSRASAFVLALWHAVHKVCRFSRPHSPPPRHTGTTWSACHKEPSVTLEGDLISGASSWKATQILQVQKKKDT